MARGTPEARFTWLDVAGNTTPPRDPDNDADDDEKEDDDVEADEDLDPAVIREPDTDE